MILGIDIGFAELGYSLISPQQEIIEVGVLRTAKQKRLSSTVDALSRALSLSLQLESVITSREGISKIVAETPTYPRHASTGIKLGISWGILCSIANRYSLPLVIIAPSQIRSGWGLVKGSDKSDLSRALQNQDPEAFNKIAQHFPVAQRQHIIDASLVALIHNRKGIIRYEIERQQPNRTTTRPRSLRL